MQVLFVMPVQMNEGCGSGAPNQRDSGRRQNRCTDVQVQAIQIQGGNATKRNYVGSSWHAFGYH